MNGFKWNWKKDEKIINKRTKSLFYEMEIVFFCNFSFDNSFVCKLQSGRKKIGSFAQRCFKREIFNWSRHECRSNYRKRYGRSEINQATFQFDYSENCMKSEVLQPQEGKFDFTLADQYVDFGQKNKMFIVGHTLIWHSQAPKWFLWIRTERMFRVKC